MRTTIVAAGRMRPPFLDDAAHYAKMLSRYTRLEVIEVRTDAAVARRMPSGALVWALDPGGEALASRVFAQKIAAARDRGRHLCLALGGPDGLDPAALDRADLRLSLGPLTLAHQLARVVVLEQLFRAHRIIAGDPYHR